VGETEAPFFGGGPVTNYRLFLLDHTVAKPQHDLQRAYRHARLICRLAKRRVPRHDELARDLIEQGLGVQPVGIKEQPADSWDEYTARAKRRINTEEPWGSNFER
jgi:hypothetical protein